MDIYEQAMNKLAKWRVLLAGWQLGTRPKGDPEGDAVRDHREATLILRAEVTALHRLMMEKGIATGEEIDRAMAEEAEHLSAAMETRFPGIRATDQGLVMELQIARHTMKGWKP